MSKLLGFARAVGSEHSLSSRLGRWLLEAAVEFEALETTVAGLVLGQSRGVLVDQLRAGIPGLVPGDVVYLQGYSSPNDGGQGEFICYVGGPFTDNGGTIFVEGGLGATAAKALIRRYSGWLDPRWFGSLCNGVTDDTDAWELTLAAVASGGSIALPGVIRLAKVGWAGTLVDGKSNITIAGYDNRNCGFSLGVLPTQTIGTAPWVYMLKFLSCENITICNLNFAVDPGINSGFIGMYHCRDMTTEDNVFHDMNGDAAGVDPISMAVCSYDGHYNVVRSNRFERCHWAVGLGLGFIGLTDHHALVEGNTFVDTTGSPINGTCSDSIIVGNMIDNSGRTAIVMGGATEMTARLLVANNYIARTTQAFQSDGISALPLSDITITGNFIGYSQGSTLAPQKLSLNGIGISLCHGVTITDNTFVDVGGTVQGGIIGVSNSQEVLIDDNRIRTVDPAVLSYAINITENANVISDGIAISNNVIVGTQDGILIWDKTNADSYKSISVTGNSVRNCPRYGFVMYPSVPSLRFSDNTLLGSGVVDFYTLQPGHEIFGANNNIGTLQISAWGTETSISQRVGWGNNRIVYIYGPPAGPAIGPPTVGTFSIGDRAVNLASGLGQVGSWVCVGAGTPGTWVVETNCGQPREFSGAGSPNGSVIGNIGDGYTDTGGGSSTTRWLKISGTATDTGWEKIATAP